MARKPRVKYSGAFYHLICRGNQRQVMPRANRYFLPAYRLAYQPSLPFLLKDDHIRTAQG
jgi:hypothetical protein